MRTRFNYPFMRFLSLRAIVDYEAVVPNPPLSDEEHERRTARPEMSVGRQVFVKVSYLLRF